MQKIKYIIIFTLLLALGMLYIQLADYKNITSTLLENNKSNKNTIQTLTNQISLLKAQNEQLQNQIITLEENLALTKIKLNTQNFVTDNNTTNTLINDLPQYIEKEEENNETTQLNPKPNITIDNENAITGFGLEYNQKF